MILGSITVYSDENKIEAVYVRKWEPEKVDTKCSESIVSYIAHFLCIEEDDLSVDSFSPFGKHAELSFSERLVENKIVVTWEHFSVWFFIEENIMNVLDDLFNPYVPLEHGDYDYIMMSNNTADLIYYDVVYDTCMMDDFLITLSFWNCVPTLNHEKIKYRGN